MCTNDRQMFLVFHASIFFALEFGALDSGSQRNPTCSTESPHPPPPSLCGTTKFPFVSPLEGSVISVGAVALENILCVYFDSGSPPPWCRIFLAKQVYSQRMCVCQLTKKIGERGRHKRGVSGLTLSTSARGLFRC